MGSLKVSLPTLMTLVLKLGFPRDVLGQTGTGPPVVPLSRDREIFLSWCPFVLRTRAGANVPGQTPLSRDVPGQNHLPLRNKKQEKRRSKTGKGCSKTEKGRSKTGKARSKTGKKVLKQERTFLNRKGLS